MANLNLNDLPEGIYENVKLTTLASQKGLGGLFKLDFSSDVPSEEMLQYVEENKAELTKMILPPEAQLDAMVPKGPFNRDPLDDVILQKDKRFERRGDFVHLGSIEWTNQAGNKKAAAGTKMSTVFKVSLFSKVQEIKFSDWPKKFRVEFMKRNVEGLKPVFPQLERATRILLHFAPNETETTLCFLENMKLGELGFILLPKLQKIETRFILVMYFAHLQACMGIIPEDQDKFMQGIIPIMDDRFKGKLRNLMSSPVREVKAEIKKGGVTIAVARTTRSPSSASSSSGSSSPTPSCGKAVTKKSFKVSGIFYSFDNFKKQVSRSLVAVHVILVMLPTNAHQYLFDPGYLMHSMQNIKSACNTNNRVKRLLCTRA